MKGKTLKIIQVVLLVLAILVFFYGIGVAREAGEERAIKRAANKVEITVTEMQPNMYQSCCDFRLKIKNDSNRDFSKIEGTLKIYDRDGELLSEGTVYFTGDMGPDSQKSFTLSYRIYDSYELDAVCNTAVADMKVTFQITSVSESSSFYGSDIDCKEQVIKPLD